MEQLRVAAIRMERRAVAVAIFIGVRLDYTQVRQLVADAAKAETSVIGFLNWILATFRIQSAAVESIDSEDQIHRAELARVAVEVLRQASVPIWEVSKAEVLASFGHPPLRNRKELREAVAFIWPILNSRDTSPWALDAAAVGLYVQTERLFIDQ